MAFTAETYRTAALEHVNAGRMLYSARRYVLAHYVAGLAVECIFRAHKCLVDPTFDERHDLHVLARAARFYDLAPRKHREISAALGVVVLQWRNAHRYRSEASLRAFLKESKLDRGLPRNTDFVKENSRRIVDAVLVIVMLGTSQWNGQVTLLRR